MPDYNLIQQYLENNELPPGALIADIHQCMSGPISQISLLQKEMAQVRARLQDARNRRAAVEEIMSPYHQVLAPIRFIPDDILRQIFISCLSSDLPYPSVHNPGLPPILLTHVCRRWRTLATDTPELWSRISIFLPPILPNIEDDDNSVSAAIIRKELADLLDESVGRANYAVEWLERSGDLPLSLNLQLSSDNYRALVHHPLSISTCSIMVQTFAMYVHRCRNLRVLITLQQLSQLDFVLSSTKLANIQSLDIYIIDNTDDIPECRKQMFSFQLLNDLPSLRRLTLGSIYEGDPIPYPPNVWRNLTELTLREPTELTMVSQILALCPSLISCEIYITLPDLLPSDPPPSRTYIFPQLHRLFITFYSSQWEGNTDTWVPPTLNISAPRLQTLIYDTEIDLDPYAYPPQEPPSILIPSFPCFPFEHILISLETPAFVEIRVSESARDSMTQALQQHGGKISHLVLGQMPRSGQFVQTRQTNADGAFKTLFPLPAWYSKALDFPLSQIPDITPEEIEKAVQDYHCPSLQELKVMGLITVNETDVLSFIACRLRVFEYARSRSEVEGERFEGFDVLKRLHVEFGRNMDREITQAVQNLARDIGVDFEIDLEYPPEELMPLRLPMLN